MKNKIIVRISAGLGNQIFGYAFAKELSLSSNKDILIDKLDFVLPWSPCRSRRYQLDRFIGPSEVRKVPIWYYIIYWPFWMLYWMLMTNKAFRFLLKKTRCSESIKSVEQEADTPGAAQTSPIDKFLKMSPIKVLRPNVIFGFDGLEEWKKIAANHSNIILESACIPYGKFAHMGEIKKDLTPVEKISVPLEIKEAKDSVSVHIRRTDYLDLGTGIALPISYYRRAVDYIAGKVKYPKFFVFSDDPDWCRQAFKDIDADVVIMSGDTQYPLKDLWIMSRCRHHIIANSSFSWWGAMLGDQSGITVYPSTWWGEPTARTMVPNSWLSISAGQDEEDGQDGIAKRG